jgi:hypothetical protein
MLLEHLKQPQIYGLIGLGGIYWGIAALTIRYVGHTLFANDLRRVATFGALIPVSYTLITVSEGLIGIRSNQRLTTATIITTAALLLDGVAFMWFPTLYENPLIKKSNPHSAMAFSRMGAASILWGVGAVFAVALLTQQ